MTQTQEDQGFPFSVRFLPLPDRQLEFALYEFGAPVENDQRPLVIAGHGIGFTGAVWAEVARLVSSTYRFVSFDLRGHGRTINQGPIDFAWTTFAADLAAILRELRPDMYVGHSFAGSHVLLAPDEVQRVLDRVIVLDPILPDPAQPKRGEQIASACRKEPGRFDTLAELYSHFETSPFRQAGFGGWSRGLMSQYCLHGAEIQADGVMRLRLQPEDEALMYASRPQFEQLLNGAKSFRAPVKLVYSELRRRGEVPETQRQLASTIADTLRDSDFVPVPFGHGLPMIAPEFVAGIILGFSV